MNSGTNSKAKKCIRDETSSPSTEVSTTKFKAAKQNIIRDLILMFIAIFVLYKISTHPMIASIGYVDPNAPKKMSKEDVLANIIKNMALGKYKEKYSKRKQMLEVLEPAKCYDFASKINAAETTISKSSTSNSKTRGKKRRRSTIKTRKNKPKDVSRRRKPFNSAESIKKRLLQGTTAPVVSSIISAAFNPIPSPARKGAENGVGSDSSMPRQRGKKKKKFGFYRS
eukprot:scaffold23125_cov91-Cyclotella_meneghiniana.AAC.6